MNSTQLITTFLRPANSQSMTSLHASVLGKCFAPSALTLLGTKPQITLLWPRRQLMIMSTCVRPPVHIYGVNLGDSYLRTHPEVLKPAIPYRPDAVFSATSYTPPKPPLGSQRYPTEVAKEEIKNTHPLDLCFKYPPEG